jgi:hypothetical protein
LFATQYATTADASSRFKKSAASIIDATLVLDDYSPDFSTEAINSALIANNEISAQSH